MCGGKEGEEGREGKGEKREERKGWGEEVGEWTYDVVGREHGA